MSNNPKDLDLIGRFKQNLGLSTKPKNRTLQPQSPIPHGGAQHRHIQHDDNQLPGLVINRQLKTLLGVQIPQQNIPFFSNPLAQHVSLHGIHAAPAPLPPLANQQLCPPLPTSTLIFVSPTLPTSMKRNTSDWKLADYIHVHMIHTASGVLLELCIPLESHFLWGGS